MSLTGRSAFRRVFRSGARRRVGCLTVLSAPGEPGLPRVGFVAGRRIGGAVARNRAKRRLREAARRVALEADTSYVMVAEAGIAEATFDRLVEWMHSAVAPEEGKGR